MRRSLQRSNLHHQKALQKLPLGVSSNFRYWDKDKTVYIDHARGCRLWDIDGNEYVDYRFYDKMAPELHDRGVLCEPDSREPLFICEAHAQDDSLAHTLKAFEQAVDVTLEKMKQ